MGVLTTNEGAVHLLALEGQGAPGNPFDRLTVGRGNNVPVVDDVFESLTRSGEEAALLDGYPRKGDTDPRNINRAADRWTWAFTFEAGGPFVASNFVVNREAAAGTAPVIFSSDEVLEKRSEERLTVFVNAKPGGAPTFSAVTEQVSVQKTKALWAPRARELAMSVGGIATAGDHRKVKPGEQVFVMALLPNNEGGLLTAAEIASSELLVFKRTRIGIWEQKEVIPLLNREREGVSSALVLDDPRWPTDGGYNASASWTVPLLGRVTEYALQLNAILGDTRISESWELDVELAPTASRR